MKHLTLYLLGAVCTALFCSAAAAQGYAIDSANSQLNFISVKNNAVAETHRFGSVSGSVGADGSAEVFIALATVDTGIEIRDTRMRELLFDVANNPLAQLQASVSAKVLAGVADGQTQSLDLPASLQLHGNTADITLPLMAVPTGDNGVLVSTRMPVLIQAEQFGLVKGINQLREIAGLKAIATAVPVTVVLRLEPVATGN